MTVHAFVMLCRRVACDKSRYVTLLAQGILRAAVCRRITNRRAQAKGRQGTPAGARRSHPHHGNDFSCDFLRAYERSCSEIATRRHYTATGKSSEHVVTRRTQYKYDCTHQLSALPCRRTTLPPCACVGRKPRRQSGLFFARRAHL